MRKKSFFKKNITKFVAVLLFSCLGLVAFDTTSASAGPAQSISQFDIYAYGYDAYGTGSGWTRNTTGNISRNDLKDLWCITTQVGYGSIDFVKIDGNRVDYSDDKSAWLKDGNIVTGWKDTIIIKDNSFVRSLGNGTHTITIQCSTSNTFPSRTLTSRAKFNVVG